MKLRLVAAVFVLVGAATAQNPDLGVSLWGLEGAPNTRVPLASELNVTWYRPEPVLLEAATPSCDDCGAARSAGMKLALVVRNSSLADKASEPIKSSTVFQQKLRLVLERFKPELLVVENEPDDLRNFAGSPEEFGAELKLACEVAHAEKVKCANGGITSLGIAAVVTDERWQGDNLDGAMFANSTEVVRARGKGGLSIPGKKITKGTSDQEAVLAATAKYLGEHRQQIQRIRELVNAIGVSGADYFNFHWYELLPENVTRVADTLHKLTKLALMTDELGQRNDRPFETGEKIKLALDSLVRPVLWAGVDGPDGRVGLVDKKGNRRSNAAAFQRIAKQAVR